MSDRAVYIVGSAIMAGVILLALVTAGADAFAHLP